ncbi:MAG: YhbY family RNA-binding protein [Candidatus Poseidonia sp.]|nr:YhbY family RNA-binding protein [Poseidonia sp.]
MAEGQSTIVNVEVADLTDIPKDVLKEATSREFRPSVRIGKGGLSETVLEEIRQQLSARGLVKIKVNKGLFERDQRNDVWALIASETQSILVLQRGNIAVLWRR